ncbi:LuxS/MPP-like metallohydrolase [Artomyces pyxidatus]|uniref:LuxS/MPP-like metallohydrolase n=1 Tax=Artomyces pyxidatus TaxID=48021 RepID=A0ACB8SKM4_9AGAM|nr:LuxS/MPP-like metallohydrolase [Artomyces pyxidatus]
MLRATRLARSARGFATVVDGASGVKVAALDNGQPTASVTVLLKAGSRYEQKPGVAHVLSNFAFKSTGKRSALGTVREAELYGGVLSSTLSREHLALTAEFLRGDEAFFVDVLASFIASAKFTRHELAEYVLPTSLAEAQAAKHTPSTRALELAHALAFRNGLGHSLFADKHVAESITAEDVRALQSQAVGDLSSVAVLGTGISSDSLSSLFDKSFAAYKSSSAGPSVAAPAAPASAYHGGSTRVSFFHGQAVFIGFGTTSAAQLPALHALSAHLSPTPAVKWSTGTAPLSTVIPTGVTARTVLLPYSDATLFGILIEGADASKVGEAAKKAVEVLKTAADGKVASEEVKRAVARARFSVAGAVEAREGLLGVFGPKVLAGDRVSVQSTLEAVEAVDAKALSKIAADLLKSKPTYVALGDVNTLPYGDEIGLSA